MKSNQTKRVLELLKRFNNGEVVCIDRIIKNAKIGANAVVTKDVPENAVMVGIPAKNVGTTTEEFKPYGITPSSDK